MKEYGVVILTVIMIVFSWYFCYQEFTRPSIMEFTTFIEKVEQHEIDQVSGDFLQDKFLTIKTTDGETYRTDNPKSTGFKRELLESGIEVIEKNSSSLINVLSLLLNLMFPILILK